MTVNRTRKRYRTGIAYIIGFLWVLQPDLGHLEAHRSPTDFGGSETGPTSWQPFSTSSQGEGPKPKLRCVGHGLLGLSVLVPPGFSPGS